ncbi:hypothetical protein HDU67_008243 [Dinochytrium kinnereticum]|nr:hypothetical protein HDU67_008243 [Dinochytrium kinnereticum]
MTWRSIIEREEALASSPCRRIIPGKVGRLTIRQQLKSRPLGLIFEGSDPALKFLYPLLCVLRSNYLNGTGFTLQKDDGNRVKSPEAKDVPTEGTSIATTFVRLGRLETSEPFLVEDERLQASGMVHFSASLAKKEVKKSIQRIASWKKIQRSISTKSARLKRQQGCIGIKKAKMTADNKLVKQIYRSTQVDNRLLLKFDETMRLKLEKDLYRLSCDKGSLDDEDHEDVMEDLDRSVCDFSWSKLGEDNLDDLLSTGPRKCPFTQTIIKEEAAIPLNSSSHVRPGVTACSTPPPKPLTTADLHETIKGSTTASPNFERMNSTIPAYPPPNTLNGFHHHSSSEVTVTLPRNVTRSIVQEVALIVFVSLRAAASIVAFAVAVVTRVRSLVGSAIIEGGKKVAGIAFGVAKWGYGVGKWWARPVLGCVAKA